MLKKALYVPALVLAVAAIVAVPSAPAAAASANGHIVDIGVKATTAAGASLGTFHLNNAVPVKAGGNYHLALIGWQVSSGKIVVVPVNATFLVVAGKANLTLSNAKDNGVDVHVAKTGGGQLKYTVGAGYIMSRNLTSGRITLR
ncbi:MAG TPA: hypothetical protein VHR45_03190 [Thermoanaerobaculia bacterium]|nr:hypothetical protein [Thermoanaerobaculia bacterium]